MLKKYALSLGISLILWGSLVTNVNAQRIAMLDIAGHRDSFIQRFTNQLGFNRIPDENKKPVMRGVLNGEEVDLIIHETPLTHRVYKVHVRFKAFPKWKLAKEYYLNKRASLEKKYGQVIKTEIQFQKPYCEGGGKEFEALKQGKGKFYCDWGDMPYIQNLFLQYWIDGDQHVYLSFTLKDEWMKFQEEDKFTQNSLF
jgi:hypothetical protein